MSRLTSCCFFRHHWLNISAAADFVAPRAAPQTQFVHVGQGLTMVEAWGVGGGGGGGTVVSVWLLVLPRSRAGDGLRREELCLGVKGPGSRWLQSEADLRS